MYAIASLLYSPDYLPGALVLAHTLRKLNLHGAHIVLLCSTHKFTSSQLRRLELLYDVIIDISVIASVPGANFQLLNRPNLACTFSKIHLWCLPYEKVLYLDCDTLPLLGSPRSVSDLLLVDFDSNEILAAPDSGFPDVFNSGVFVIKPNPHDHNMLMLLAASRSEDVSFDGADQGLFNQYFNADPDWVQKSVNGRPPTSRWVKIPFLYNTTPNTHYEYLPAYNYFLTSALAPRLKLVHFIGPQKPWQGSQSGLFQEWWDKWNDYSGGGSIRDVLFNEACVVKINPLVPTGGHQDDVVPESDYVESYLFDKTESAFNPADLCDPMNYQDLGESFTNTNGAASWDATQEPPPQIRPEPSKLQEHIKQFENTWDTVPEPETKKEDTQLVPESLPPLPGEAQKPEPEHGADQQTSTTYGVHREQKPERVFDGQPDYVPEHVLLKKAEPVQAEITSKLQNIDINAEETTENDEITDEHEPSMEETSTEDAQKIFPWEFRPPRPVERVFD